MQETSWPRKQINSFTRLVLQFRSCKAPDLLDFRSPALPLPFESFNICLVADLLINLELKLSFSDSWFWYHLANSISFFSSFQEAIWLSHCSTHPYSVFHVFPFFSHCTPSCSYLYKARIIPLCNRWCPEYLPSHPVSSLKVSSLFNVLVKTHRSTGVNSTIVPDCWGVFNQCWMNIEYYKVQTLGGGLYIPAL